MRAVYLSPNPDQGRASALGLSFILDPFSQPHVLISGNGQTVSISEPTTKQAVDAAMQPFLDADAAARATAATQQGNIDTLTSRAQIALAANAAFQAIASPTNAQTLAQVQLLTKECNALIRIVLNLADSIAGT